MLRLEKLVKNPLTGKYLEVMYDTKTGGYQITVPGTDKIGVFDAGEKLEAIRYAEELCGVWPNTLPGGG